MKKQKEVVVQEVRTEIVDEDGGLVTLLGQNVCLLCLNYIYYGKLTGVNTTCVELTDAGIVYQTGKWNLPEWKNFQKLPFEKTFVKVDAIESYGQVDKTKK